MKNIKVTTSRPKDAFLWIIVTSLCFFNHCHLVNNPWYQDITLRKKNYLLNFDSLKSMLTSATSLSFLEGQQLINEEVRYRNCKVILINQKYIYFKKLSQ